MTEIKIRAHGRWHPIDWLTIGIWVLLASIVPSFRRRYWSRYWTVSIFTRILYGPKGKTPSESLLRHEQRHIEQAQEHGRWRQGWRYVTSQRWRIWYEAEAYLAGGTGIADTITAIAEGPYFVTWPREHVTALVAEARIQYRERMLDLRAP